ncbi:MAG: hypothetical protein CMH24_03450 [Nitrosomonadales bacterium]|nr:hypothetical protein [Nitrosomonadales bacterium]|tara:strand:- start:133 stop:636 length:504 start_codon:yes stop_codon:yes gene_type:complete
MKFKILNFILFQLGWFILILGAAWNETFTAVILSLSILALHLSIIDQKLSEIKLILIAGFIGFLFDGIIQYYNLIIYNSPGWEFPLTPIWIIILWMFFAITLNHSLVWLKNRLLLSSLFGAIGGPLAYIAGEKLGAITITQQFSLVLLSIGWALITPILLSIGKTND